MRSLSGEILQNLCHTLKEKYDIGANFYLVGSGARNLILQNENEPVDLDYNLEIVRCDNFNDCRTIKECVSKAFNEVLTEYDLPNCEDSTSSLTTEKIHFTKGNNTEFSIDICIVKTDMHGMHRLIHDKTGFVCYNKYIWNLALNSKDIRKKVEKIKHMGKWEDVREQYKDIKNRYLSYGDHNHPSFVCYIEAVNNVYNSINIQMKIKYCKNPVNNKANVCSNYGYAFISAANLYNKSGTAFSRNKS